MNPPQGGDPWRPPPDQMPPPPAPQQQQDGSRWNAPPPSGPPVNALPSYQLPSRQQNSNMSTASGSGLFQQPSYPSHNTNQSQRKRSLVTDGMDSPPSSAKRLRQDSSALNQGDQPSPTEENETDTGTSSLLRVILAPSILRYMYTLVYVNMSLSDD